MSAAHDHRLIRALCDSELPHLPREIHSVDAGLGARRFYRLFFDGGSTATMIARLEDTPSQLGSHSPPIAQERATHPIAKATPPVWLSEPALEPIRTLFEDGGLPVPKSFARDPESGIELLEDVGSRTLMAARGPERARLYGRACDFVPKVQRLRASPEQVPAFGRIYDRALLESKFWKFEHWTIPGLLGREAQADERDALAELTEKLSIEFENAPRRLAHRDFKAENLHWMPQEAKPGRGKAESDGDGHLVMIDVQGAFMAPPEYDLVCLLYDLQVELDEDLIAVLFEQTRPLLPDAPSLEEANRRFDLLAVARLCKDVSHVVEAGLVRNDRRRWHEIPHGLELLARAAGRQKHTFPCLRALTSVIPALTAEARSSDSPGVESSRN